MCWRCGFACCALITGCDETPTAWGKRFSPRGRWIVRIWWLDGDGGDGRVRLTRTGATSGATAGIAEAIGRKVQGNVALHRHNEGKMGREGHRWGDTVRGFIHPSSLRTGRMRIGRAGLKRASGRGPDAPLRIHQAEVRERAEVLDAFRGRRIAACLGIDAAVLELHRQDQELLTCFERLGVIVHVRDSGRGTGRCDRDGGFDAGEAIVHGDGLTNATRCDISLIGAEVEGASGELGRARVHARRVELIAPRTGGEQ